MKLDSDKSDLLARFSRDGFVAWSGFLADDELSELVGQVDRFIDQVVPRLPAEAVFYEDKNNPATLKQIQHMEDNDLWFHNLFTNGRFRDLAEFLLHGPVVPKNMQYFHKPPRVGKPTPPHQDGYYFMLDPCEAVTMWFALDQVDEENGCVRYVRGSNHRGMRPHGRTQTLGFSQGIVDFPTQNDMENEIAILAQPGDLLVHSAMTIHRAGPNQSETRTRRALGFIYYSQQAQENGEAHSAYQNKLAKELKAKGKL